VSPVVGPLHTVGTAIVDASGRSVRLVGVNEGRLDVGDGDPGPDSCGRRATLPRPSEYSNVPGWGFNSVRLAVSWANLEPTAPSRPVGGGPLTHHWNATYLALLDQVISGFAANHVGVILDLHQSFTSPAFKGERKDGRVLCEGEGFPTWLFPLAGSEDHDTGRCEVILDQREAGVPEGPIAGMEAAWTLLASRYATTSAVIGADLFNEPDPAPECATAGGQVDADEVALGHAVATVAPHLLLIFEENSNAGTVGFALPSKPALSNEVYSFHFYPASLSAGLGLLDRSLARARAWNVPALVGEFDAFGYGRSPQQGADPSWRADTTALLAVLKASDVGWMFWEYSGTESLVQPGRSVARSDLLSVLQSGQ